MDRHHTYARERLASRTVQRGLLQQRKRTAARAVAVIGVLSVIASAAASFFL
jgi:hypothetical protein